MHKALPDTDVHTTTTLDTSDEEHTSVLGGILLQMSPSVKYTALTPHKEQTSKTHILYRLCTDLFLLNYIAIVITCCNNNNDLFCTNILEGKAQWRDKSKGLSKLVIVKQCISRQWMDEEARKLRRIGSIKEIGF